MGEIINISGVDTTRKRKRTGRSPGSMPDAPPEIEGKCNCLRYGKRCKRAAGWGTDHVGFGTCKQHLGNAPANVISAHKEEVVEYTRTLAGEVEMNPVEALLWAVRLGAGAVAYWQELLTRDDLPIEVALMVETVYGVERDRMAKTAALCISAGIAERRIRIAEAQGDMLAMILETALEAEGLKPAKILAVKKRAAALLVALPGVSTGVG